MWSFREGLYRLIDALRERLRFAPLTGIHVRTVRRMTNEGWRVQSDGRDGWDAEVVVLTCPAFQQAMMLADEDADLATAIDAIPYTRVVVVALGYRAADVPGGLDGFGYLSPQRERRDVLGVQWCSSIFPERRSTGFGVAACHVRRLESSGDARLGRRAVAQRGSRRVTVCDANRGGPGLSSHHPLAACHSAVSSRSSRARGLDRESVVAPSRSISGRQRLSRSGSQRLHRTGWI